MHFPQGHVTSLQKALAAPKTKTQQKQQKVLSDTYQIIVFWFCQSTIDNALETRFGISGQALSWFRSYLNDRFWPVRIDGSFSHKHKLDCGVPQGSVLGPQLFTLHSSPVTDIARQHNLGVHLYVDDSQLYLAFKILDTTQTVSNVEDCVEGIQSWDCTQTHDESRKNHHHPANDDIFTRTFSISGANIPVTHVARSLGVL